MAYSHASMSNVASSYPRNLSLSSLQMASRIATPNCITFLSLNPKVNSSDALLTEQMNQAQVWHRRLGHLSYKNLHYMTQNNSVAGTPKISLVATICKSCQKGRQARRSFPKKSFTRGKRILEIIHSDLCDPITLMSSGKVRCFMTLTDDFLRKSWFCFLKNKADVLSKFQEFKTTLEGHT